MTFFLEYDNNTSFCKLLPHQLGRLIKMRYVCAVKNHRKKRAKKRTRSSLELIKGVGVKKRSELLNYFGGIQEIDNASIDELQKVVGINLKLATKICES